jgi:hypothetical protein
MRVAHDTCGKCNEDKRPHQRLYFYLVPALVVFIGIPGFLSL